MPHDLDLIFTLAGGLTAAWILGLVSHRLRLSPIVGYLLAGIVVGPFTPGFVGDKAPRRGPLIERNPDVVARLRAEGIRAFAGDASDLEVPREAGVAEAGSLLFTSSGTPPIDVVRNALALNPALTIVARSAYVSEAPDLLDAGVSTVIAGEADTRDQVDRARERVRSELEPRRP